ncbi:MAG: DUF2069 domain-containing protein [Porticoccaceae bacterium]
MDTDTKLSIGRQVVRISYAMLLMVLAANLWQENQPPVIYFIVLIPLLIFIPGLLMDSIRTLIWLGFVLLIYFAGSVYGVADPEVQTLDIAELVLTVVLFCSAMIYARLRQVNDL